MTASHWMLLGCLLLQSAAFATSLFTVHLKKSKPTTGIPLKTCYDDILPIHDTIPTLSSDIKPLMLSSRACCNVA